MCAHLTITMHEHLYEIVWWKISKTFVGKTVTSSFRLFTFISGIVLYCCLIFWKDILLLREARLGKQLEIRTLHARNNYMASYFARDRYKFCLIGCVRRRGGGCTGCTCTPTPTPPTWRKSSAQTVNPKEEREFRSDMSAKKNVHVPLRYDKTKTKKVGKKEDISKRKGIKLKK